MCCFKQTRKKSKGCNFPGMHPLAKKNQVSLNCWLMLLEHEDFYRYIPQCGDEVMYLPEVMLFSVAFCDGDDLVANNFLAAKI